MPKLLISNQLYAQLNIHVIIYARIWDVLISYLDLAAKNMTCLEPFLLEFTTEKAESKLLCDLVN